MIKSANTLIEGITAEDSRTLINALFNSGGGVKAYRHLVSHVANTFSVYTEGYKGQDLLRINAFVTGFMAGRRSK